MGLRLKWIKRVAGRLARSVLSRENTDPVSTEIELIGYDTALREQFTGWHDSGVARLQDASYRPLIEQMYAGNPRQDLVAASEAVGQTGLANPSILEVGCGSGYYSEILSHILKRPLRYTGLDYSPTMIQLACEHYPGQPFLVGDATTLPFADGTFDIVMNGVSLMHILNYESAIAESRRVAKGWCVFHTVPVLQNQNTKILRKKAYGQPTIEIIFNEKKLLSLMDKYMLVVRHTMESIPYNLEEILGEATVTKTYVCEVSRQ